MSQGYLFTMVSRPNQNHHTRHSDVSPQPSLSSPYLQQSSQLSSSSIVQASLESVIQIESMEDHLNASNKEASGKGFKMQPSQWEGKSMHRACLYSAFYTFYPSFLHLPGTKVSIITIFSSIYMIRFSYKNFQYAHVHVFLTGIS